MVTKGSLQRNYLVHPYRCSCWMVDLSVSTLGQRLQNTDKAIRRLESEVLILVIREAWELLWCLEESPKISCRIKNRIQSATLRISEQLVSWGLASIYQRYVSEVWNNFRKSHSLHVSGDNPFPYPCRALLLVVNILSVVCKEGISKLTNFESTRTKIKLPRFRTIHTILWSHNQKGNSLYFLSSVRTWSSIEHRS